MSRPPAFITASEIARHRFCARALMYDYRYAAELSPAWYKRLVAWLMWPILGGLAIAIGLHFLVLEDWALTFSSWVGGVLLFLGLRLAWGRLRQQPPNLMIYHGSKAKRNHQQMVASEFGLTGRPDYLLEREGLTIPILTKNNPAPTQPHEAHVLQVLAYCLLVSENSPRHPPYGIIRYGDGRTFEVDFDEDAVEYLSQTMDQIELNRVAQEVAINHQDRGRCFACRYRRECDQSLFT
jgi:CRISPR-associated exonuclease Cas4